MSCRIGLADLVEPLQSVTGALDRRSTLPILSHLYCEVSDQSLTMIGSDQELELQASCQVTSDEPELEFTLPGRKFAEICRYLPGDASLELEFVGQSVHLNCGRFKSQLATLPGLDFPLVEVEEPDIELTLPADDLRQLIDKAAFAMAVQDVRYFFNGLLLEFVSDEARSEICAVATNGQRLAFASLELPDTAVQSYQAIVPRKAVQEMLKVAKGQGEVTLAINRNHLKLKANNRQMITKLIDASYPDYQKAIPEPGSKQLCIDRLALKSALARISILSNELYRNARLALSSGLLTLSANNPQQEEAEEQLSVDYEGESLEIGFNVSYLTDVLGALSGDQVQLNLSKSNEPMLLIDPDRRDAKYVISPMVI